MTTLEQVQNKLNAKSEQTDWEVYDAVSNCAKMLRFGGDKKAVSGFLEMARYFFGKDKIAETIETNGFEELRNF